MSIEEIKFLCPKCSSSDNSYLFCKECNTYYCIPCCLNYYKDIEIDKIIPIHNPHCNKEDDMSSINLSDYDE